MKIIYKQQIIYPLLIIIFFFVFSTAELYPEENNIHVGILGIYPFVSIEEIYNDNIFRESGSDLKNDWITEAKMGIGLNIPLVPERKNDFAISADYKCKMINYMEYKDESRIDHAASAGFDLHFANKVFVSAKDDYEKTADPATSEMTRLEKRYRNNAGLIFGRNKKYFGFNFGYSNIRDGYETRNNLDKYDNRINANIYIKPLPKTAVSIEYISSTISYDENTTNSNSNSQEPGLAIKGKIAPKTSGTIKGGYRLTNYDDESKEDFKGFTAFGNITFKLKERFILNIYGERQPHESTFLTNSYFISNNFGAAVDLRFVNNFFAAVDGIYRINQYPVDSISGVAIEKREDKLYGGNASLRYELKGTVTLKFAYKYMKRDSNIDYFDYKNNQYSGSILLEF